MKLSIALAAAISLLATGTSAAFVPVTGVGFPNHFSLISPFFRLVLNRLSDAIHTQAHTDLAMSANSITTLRSGRRRTFLAPLITRYVIAQYKEQGAQQLIQYRGQCRGAPSCTWSGGFATCT